MLFSAVMDGEFNQVLERYSDGLYQPVTFLERGVAIPFTTPILLGARARPIERGLELVLANPSGGQGHYVIPFAALPDICSPTLHDRKLFERVTRLVSPTPSAMREAAREVAKEGWAGRQAAEAAREAMRDDEARRLLTHFELLLLLTRQVEGPGIGPPIEQDTRAAQQARAKQALGRITQRFAAPPDELPIWLEKLAALYADHGVGAQAATAPTPRRLKGLRALSHAVQAHGRQSTRQEEAASAQLIAEAADLTLKAVQDPVARMEEHLADAPTLLVRMGQDPRLLTQLAAMPDWLLDGWATIQDLWDVAPPAWRGHALAEMAALIPVIPREVQDWTRAGSEWNERGSAHGALARRHRYVIAREDWRSGRMIDLLARNERLRAIRP